MRTRWVDIRTTHLQVNCVLAVSLSKKTKETFRLRNQNKKCKICVKNVKSLYERGWKKWDQTEKAGVKRNEGKK